MAATPQAEEFAGSEPADGVQRRPLAGICLSAIAGWIFGFTFLPSSPLLLVIATPLVLAAFYLAHSRWTSSALHTSVALIAAAHAALSADPPAANFLPRLLERQRESVELVGVVGDEPEMRDGEMWVFPLKVEGLRQTVEWQRAMGVVEVRWPVKSAHDARPEYGQRWHFFGLVSQRPPRGNEPTLLMRARGDATFLGVGVHSRFYSWCLAQRKRAAAMLGTGLRERDFPQELAMMRALILGERTDIDQHVRQTFARTGTLHIVAISGSHVAVFFGLIAAVLRSMGVPRTSWALFATPVLIVYTAMAGLPSSAVRSCIMAVVFTSAPLFRRKTDPATALAVSALLVLAVEPRDIFDAGFLLSFLVVGGLMVFYRPIFHRISRWLPEEPWRIEISMPSRILRWLAREGASLFAASLAAWLVSEPLTAIFFNLRSPVAILANLAVVPLAFFILFGGCLSLVAGFVFGSFWSIPAELFNHATRVFVRAMLWVVDKSSAMPGAYQFVRSPSLFWVIVFYALLFAVFFSRGRLRLLSSVTASLLIALWCGDYVFTRHATMELFRPGSTPVLFLDLPRDQDVLVDTGEAFYSTRLLRFLHERGVDHLRALVLTRPAADALGGAQALLAEIPADEVWISAWHGRSRIADEFAKFCSARNIRVRALKRGDGGEICAGVRWEALHPQSESKYRSAAEGGLILRWTRGSAAVVFAGGGGTECEREVVSWRHDVDADVLLAGAKMKSGWGAGFVDAVHPRLVVVPRSEGVSEAAADAAGAVGRAEVVGLGRDEVWRMVLPVEGKFQWLEVVEEFVSSGWKLGPGAVF